VATDPEDHLLRLDNKLDYLVTSPLMSKRIKLDGVPPELDAYHLDDFAAALEKEGGRDLVAEAIITMTAKSGLSLSDLQKLGKETDPVFSNSKPSWTDVAPNFGLDATRDINQLDTFSVPRLYLPPSFHRQVMEKSAQWMVVYQDLGSGTARVRLMDAVRLSLFIQFIRRELISTFSGSYPFSLYLGVASSIKHAPCIIDAHSSTKFTCRKEPSS
jgi:hypothetical protein